ncbi:MAG TPA: winged helix-turn-helix domain-containing protein [Ilumatobacteraceae bacterium]|nr:winged helix-turn-helix domain-containing protein [Ilumatobacteraceae bacterium]
MLAATYGQCLTSLTPDLQPSTLRDDGRVRFEFGEFQLDDTLDTLVGPAGPVHIEPQVFKVLRHLIVNRDRVVSKEELLDSIWGDRFVSNRRSRRG